MDSSPASSNPRPNDAVPLTPAELPGGSFGRVQLPDGALDVPRIVPLPRTPRRASRSPEGTLGLDAESVDYFAHQHVTWTRLCGLQRDLVRERCAPQYAAGRKLIDRFTHRIPTLSELDAWLARTTGWRVVRANGYVSPSTFLALLADRRFPCMDLLRHADELFYSPEPDMYHDILGHLPMLCNRQFAEYYLTFGKAGARVRHPEQLRALNRIYWFTMEFGLLRSASGPLAYGAALLTGLGELLSSSDASVMHRPFGIGAAIETPTDIHRTNEVLYLTPSFDVLLAEFVDWARSECLL